MEEAILSYKMERVVNFLTKKKVKKNIRMAI